MTFNQSKFRKFCRTVPQSALQERLGLSRQTLYNRLKQLDKLPLVDFLAICEVIDEPPETFIEGTNS